MYPRVPGMEDATIHRALVRRFRYCELLQDNSTKMRVPAITGLPMSAFGSETTSRRDIRSYFVRAPLAIMTTQRPRLSVLGFHPCS